MTSCIRFLEHGQCLQRGQAVVDHRAVLGHDHEPVHHPESSPQGRYRGDGVEREEEGREQIAHEEFNKLTQQGGRGGGSGSPPLH